MGSLGLACQEGLYMVYPLVKVPANGQGAAPVKRQDLCMALPLIKASTRSRLPS